MAAARSSARCVENLEIVTWSIDRFSTAAGHIEAGCPGTELASGR
jgi:hypothetical protein